MTQSHPLFFAAVALLTAHGCVLPQDHEAGRSNDALDGWGDPDAANHLPPPGSDPVDDPCDGYDNDVDGDVDEGCYCGAGDFQPCYPGKPGADAHGICRAGVQHCVDVGTEFMVGHWGPCVDAVTAEAEVCGNDVDEDCDGVVLSCSDQACHDGDSMACFDGADELAGIGECRAGTRTCSDGAWGPCEGQVLPSDDVCGNGLDEDCDGADATCVLK